MPKLNREQRFAVLKNIFNELGELSATRSAARLQIPADEARRLIQGWASGDDPQPTAVADEPEEDKHRERLAAREAVRPQRVQRASSTRVFRQPKRIQRPVTGKPGYTADPPKRIQREVKPPPVFTVPAEKETGDDWRDGYRGAKLFKGTHVKYENGEAIGVIVTLGRDVSEVKWFRTGAVQSELNKYLRKASR